MRIWVAKYEAGSFDSDVVAAEMVQTQEARIAALERLVGKLLLENELLKGASRDAARPRSHRSTSFSAWRVVKSFSPSRDRLPRKSSSQSVHAMSQSARRDWAICAARAGSRCKALI